MKKTLILGLGNPILTDDGIGIHVVRALAAKNLPPDVECAETSIGGLRLLDILAGYERIVIVDAVQIPGGKPGELYPLHPDDVRTSLHAGSTHDLTLPGALKLGRSLKMKLPEDRAIKIVGIQVEDVLTLKEDCTPAVKAAIPRAVNAVLAELERET